MKRLSLWLPWRSTKPPRPNDRRPRLELLEGRDVPSTLFSVTTTNRLVRFDSAAPAASVTSVPITGLVGVEEERVVAIDFRPRTGQLYALGVDRLATPFGFTVDSLKLYTLNPLSGAATFVGTPSTVESTSSYGFDFDPTADLLRVVNSTGINIRLNPNTGERVGSSDSALNPIPTFAIGSAYDRNFDGKLGAAGTTLYAISVKDTGGDSSLVTQGGLNQSPSPNGGTLNEVGPLGVPIFVPGGIGFDIAASATAGGTGLAVFTNLSTGLTGLYSINLSTGTATLIGPVGDGKTELTGLAIAPGSRLAMSAIGAETAVRVFDGFTNRQIRTGTPFPGFSGEVRVAMADINRDAVPDLIAAATVNAHVRVFDGVTGVLLHNFIAFPGYFGAVAVAAGDVNGDGFDDIVVSADGAPGGHVRAFSGPDLTWLANFLSWPGYGDRVSLAAADFNRDGIDEIVTAVGIGGHVKVYTRAGALFSTSTFFGSFLTFQGYNGPINLTAGDVTGDGLADIIVGAAVGRGHVKAYSGASTRKRIASFFAYESSNRNGVQVALADFDRDGRLDIRTAPGQGRDLEVRAFNAITLALLNVFEPFEGVQDGAYLAGARG